MRSTHDILGEDDFEFVQKFDSPEKLILEVQKLQQRCALSTVTRLLKNVKPSLIHLQAFATFMAVSVGSESINLACMWGAIFLLIQVGWRKAVCF